MLKVDFIDYKVRKLDMVNNLGMDESAEASGISGFSVNFDGDRAVATLTECLELEGSYNQFHIELELDGYFSIQGITSNKVKKEAHVKCYDCLFPYADQIIRMLSVNSGILMLKLKKKDMDTKHVHIGDKPKAVRDEKVIDFQPDTDR